MNITWNLGSGTHRQRRIQGQAHQNTQALSLNDGESNEGHDFIIYNNEYRIQICPEHGYSVRNLMQHLLHEHTLPLSQRKAILAAHANDDCVRPDQVTYPKPFRPPINGLREPRAAYLCLETGCGEIRTNLDGIRMHANRQHQWRKTQLQPEFWRPVTAQTFFLGGGYTKYFTVQPEVNDQVKPPARTRGNGYPATPASQPSLSIEAQQDLERIKDEWSAARQKHQETLERLDTEIMKQDRTGWFNRTGWVKHLAERNLKHLAHASRLPDRDEQVLLEAVRVLDLLMTRAVAGLLTLDLELRR